MSLVKMENWFDGSITDLDMEVSIHVDKFEIKMPKETPFRYAFLEVKHNTHVLLKLSHRSHKRTFRSIRGANRVITTKDPNICRHFTAYTKLGTRKPIKAKLLNPEMIYIPLEEFYV